MAKVIGEKADSAVRGGGECMHIPLSWSLGVLLLGGAVGAVGAEEIVAREGGLGFRFDDNQTAAKWREMAAVFEKHGFPMMMSLNYGTLLSAPSELITEPSTLKDASEYVTSISVNQRLDLVGV